MFFDLQSCIIFFKWSQLGEHYYLVYLFQLLCMFRATMCPSSGELTVSLRHWYFSLRMGGLLLLLLLLLLILYYFACKWKVSNTEIYSFQSNEVLYNVLVYLSRYYLIFATLFSALKILHGWCLNQLKINRVFFNAWGWLLVEAETRCPIYIKLLQRIVLTASPPILQRLLRPLSLIHFHEGITRSSKTPVHFHHTTTWHRFFNFEVCHPRCVFKL